MEPVMAAGDPIRNQRSPFVRPAPFPRSFYMVLKQLKLLSFRSHQDSSISFTPGVNLICGPNGAGKTNVLEAIHFLCLSKSFLATSDQYAQRKGDAFFQIDGAFESELRGAIKGRLVYARGEGKKLFINQAPLERLADIVGRLPVVIASPSDHALTAEGPEIRRRFLDNIISQSRPVYLEDLLQYRRALKQRNALLANFKYHRTPIDPPLLASWDAQLVTAGSRLVYGRTRFLETFKNALHDAYQALEGVGEKPSVEYRTVMETQASVSPESIQEKMEEVLHQSFQKDRDAGRTLNGPHRDDLYFHLDGMAVRRYASQGQHRTFGLALKLAQYFYLNEQLGETPILLLDDVFGNLDPRRTGIVLELLKSNTFGQTIVTATHTNPFEKWITFDRLNHSCTAVHKGKIVMEGDD